MEPQSNQPVMDNVGTNPLVVTHPKAKSAFIPVLVTVLMSIVTVGGLFAYTLNQYPGFYSNLGLIDEASNREDQDSNDDEGVDYGEPADDSEVEEEVKWVTYENKTLGLKFKLPSNYVVSYDEIQEDEGNPYSYSVTVSTIVRDLKGKNSARLYEVVNFTTNKMLLYTYDDAPGKLPDWAPAKITVGGKSYNGEAYSMGEGFYGTFGGSSAVRYAIRSDFFAYIVSPFFSETPTCEEIDGKEECYTADSEYRVVQADLDNAKKIIESLELLK